MKKKLFVEKIYICSKKKNFFFNVLKEIELFL